MKYVSALTEGDQEALTYLYATSTAHRQRQRAKAVLLSARGYTLDQIADVPGSTRRAVSGWLARWQETRKGSGRFTGCTPQKKA